jgi:hypothetical protein
MDWDTWNQQYRREQIQKWRNRIDLRIATDRKIQEYTSAKLYEYMECDCDGYGYNIWFFFYEDFNYFTAKDFNRLGQHHLKELRKQLKEEYRPPSTDNEYDRFLARFEALPIEALPIEALPIEALPIEALPIEALPVETNESAIPVEIDERAEPSVEDVYTFNTLVSPPSPLRSIPGTGFEQFHALQPINGSSTSTHTSASFEFQALQRTGVG